MPELTERQQQTLRWGQRLDGPIASDIYRLNAEQVEDLLVLVELGYFTEADGRFQITTTGKVAARALPVPGA